MNGEREYPDLTTSLLHEIQIGKKVDDMVDYHHEDIPRAALLDLLFNLRDAGMINLEIASELTDLGGALLHLVEKSTEDD